MSDETNPGPTLLRRLLIRARLVPMAVEAAFELLLATLMTRLPERRYFRFYGLGAKDAAPPAPVDPRAGVVGRAVTRLAGFLPARTVCLQQALAAHRMLRRRGLPSTIVFGLLPGQQGTIAPEGVTAHAWVLSGEHVVTGLRGDLASFTVVGRYA